MDRTSLVEKPISWPQACVLIAALVVGVTASDAVSNQDIEGTASKPHSVETGLENAMRGLEEVMERSRRKHREIEKDRARQKGEQPSTPQQHGVEERWREAEIELRRMLEGARIEYIGQIKNKIERNWLRPPGSPMGLRCVVRIWQIPGGEVVQAEIMTSSGNVAFDRSVEEAVLRSSPLPVPRDPALFERSIIISFEPEGRLPEQLARDNAEHSEYIDQIKNKIKRNWFRPPGTPPNLKSVVGVSQSRGGEVVRAVTLTSSGNVAFDRSVKDAVLCASPLPMPKDAALFERDIVMTLQAPPHAVMEDAPKELSLHQEPAVVTLDARGNYYVNYGENQGSPVPPDVLEARISALLRDRPDIWVALRADEHAAPQEISALIALLRRTGADISSLEESCQRMLEGARIEYIGQIKNKIERNWLRPPGSPVGLRCVVGISQIPGGEVVQTAILTSSGNIAFDRSVEEAVLRSSPLPVPRDPALFERNIKISFEPEGGLPEIELRQIKEETQRDLTNLERARWEMMKAEAERKRIETAKKRAEAVRKRAEAERKRAVAKGKRIEEARRKQAERKRIEDARRREAERALQEAIAQDARELEHEQNTVIIGPRRLHYIAHLKVKIERNWRRPPSTSKGLTATVRVTQETTGKVTSVEIHKSSGYRAFDESIKDAILRASPLPVPEDPSLFDRQIIITFQPED